MPPDALKSRDFAAESHPEPLFAAWLDEARGTEINDPTAMALASVGADGLPDARMVLLKTVDAGGFVFYTNIESAKGRELAANRQAAALFHWKSLRRQIRIRGDVEQVSDAESDAYFFSRPLESRIGAWASAQSRPLESRRHLEERVATFAARFAENVPRPDYWRGYRIRPRQIEFWSDGAHRLHDRITFTRAETAASWTTAAWSKERLYP